jgi:TPR repeat protein
MKQTEQTYLRGKLLFDTGCYAEAAAPLLEAAEKGSVDAMNDLGFLYRSGLGVAKDWASAKAWYQAAAEAGHADACHNLAVLLLEGAAPDSVPAALKWLTVNAARGHSLSQLQLGQFYRKGQGVEADLNEAMRLFSAAASQGNDDAQFLIGIAAKYGATDHQGPYPTRQACEASASSGDAAAMRLMGAYWMLGFGSAADGSEAQAWMQRAVEAGDVPAQSALGVLLFDTDQEAAIELWQDAVEKGSRSAMYLLATHLLDGDVAPQDLERGAALLESAASKGHIDAMVLLADHYRVGDVLRQDGARCVHWYKCAAEAGHAVAQMQLGMLLAAGSAVEQNVWLALFWIESSAKLGWADAQCTLGVHYLQGDGVAQDYGVATRWLRAAAEQGHAHASFVLGHCYRGGLGVPADQAFGLHCWRKAAGLGHSQASEELQKAGKEDVPIFTAPQVPVPPPLPLHAKPDSAETPQAVSIGSLIVRQRWADAFVLVMLALIVLFVATWFADSLVTYRGTIGWTIAGLFLVLLALLPSDQLLAENKPKVELLAKEGSFGATVIAFLLPVAVGFGFHSDELLELAGYSKNAEEKTEVVAGAPTSNDVVHTPAANEQRVAAPQVATEKPAVQKVATEKPAAATLFAVIRTGTMLPAIPGLWASSETFDWRQRTQVIPIRFDSRPGDYGPSRQLHKPMKNLDGSPIVFEFQSKVYLSGLKPGSTLTPLPAGDWSNLSQWEQQLNGLFGGKVPGGVSEVRTVEVIYFWNPEEAQRYHNHLPVGSLDFPPPPQLKGR